MMTAIGKIIMHIKGCAKKRRTLLYGFITLFAFIALLDISFPPPLQERENFSPLVIDRNGNWVHAFINKDGNWRFHADIEALDSAFIERLLQIEDKRFYSHNGVDLLAVIRAAQSAISSGRIVSGASTITMQTARLLEPRPRHLGSKLIEMLRALQIERRLSKDEILSLYLTLAPYGSNIQGIRAASLIWFEKEPGHLTNAEQALLIALPQAPEARRPDRKPENAKSSRQKILNKLIALDLITPRRGEEAARAPLPSKKHAFKQAAWHFAHSVSRGPGSSQNKTQQNASIQGVVHTTLDIGLQTGAEKLVAHYAKQWRDETTAAVIIVDNHSRDVRALVGSSSRKVAGGWIDLTNALRSPGSTLKPFIYGLAFEDGLLNANQVINDMPRSFRGYSPENFDRTFRGEVRIREALQHSLNIPAVAALESVGSARFSAAVNMAGADLKTRARADKKDGLALALGGAGIRMRDLASLYAALAQDGKIHPLRVVMPSGDQNKKKQVLGEGGYQFISAQNAKKIAKILYDVPSLKGRAPAKLVQNAPNIAFKTGTSYGFRDAWAAGFNDQHTIIVWVGRADGAPRPGATGRKVAAPLLFSLFDLIARENLDQDPIENEAIDNGDENIEDLLLVTIPDHEEGIYPVKSHPPSIVFPQNGIEIFIGPKTAKRGIALSGRGGAGQASWYVEGQKIFPDPLGQRHLWFPERGGFYTIAMVDESGKSAKVQVRVRTKI